MIIVQLITTLGYGGAEKICIELSNSLAEEVEVEKIYLISLFDLTPNDRPRASINSKVELITLGKKKGLDYVIFIKLKQLLKKINPDIIHTHLTGLFYTFPYILGKMKGKVIHTVHNLPSKDVSKPYQIIHRYLFRRNLVRPIGISPEIVTSIAQFYNIGLPTLIENFTTRPQRSDNYNFVKTEIDNYRKDSFTKIFVNIARINPQKNQKTLIDVFKSLKDENVVLLIIGGAGEAFEQLAIELKSLAGKTDNVYLLGNKENVADYMYNADVYILSSLFEGLPVSLLEGLAVGLTPLSTPVGGVPSVVTDDIGFLAKDANKGSLIESIKEYLNTDPETLSKLRENGKKLFNDKYGIASGVKKYLDVYKNLLNT